MEGEIDGLPVAKKKTKNQLNKELDKQFSNKPTLNEKKEDKI